MAQAIVELARERLERSHARRMMLLSLDASSAVPSWQGVIDFPLEWKSVSSYPDEAELGRRCRNRRGALGINLQPEEWWHSPYTSSISGGTVRSLSRTMSMTRTICDVLLGLDLAR